LAILGFGGVTVIDTRAAAVTVSEVEPETLPEVAIMLVEPTATPVANPLEPAVSLMVAMELSDDLQFTEVVMSCVVLSVKAPMAANCCCVPLAMLGFGGVTVIDTRVAAVTVSVVEPETLPEVAVIVVEPAAIPEANPLEPAVSLMVAMELSDELQRTEVVISCIVLSEKVPMAANCCCMPFTIIGFGGVTVIDTRVAAVTVSVVEPRTLPAVAVIVVEPAATLVANPLEPAISLVVATDVSAEPHITELVRS